MDTSDGSRHLVYLDNAATTPVWPEVAAEVARAMRADNLLYGNPSSRHHLGGTARSALERARERVARLVGADPDEIYFTSGATEANNTAVFGAARPIRGGAPHLIVSAVEHPSVLEPAAALASEGAAVTKLGVTADGVIDLVELESRLRAETALVSCMLVNNETGALMPVEDVVRRVRTRSPHALVHTDVVQAAGRMRVDLHALGVDLASVSAHKLHGPKGVGCLFVRKGVRLRPLLWGGGQERGLRNGTENLPGVAGFGLAAEMAAGRLDDSIGRLQELGRSLRTGIQQAYPSVRFLGPAEESRRVAHIVSAVFEPIRSDVLANHLDEEAGVMVSVGAACSSHKARVSHVLKAMGEGDRAARSTIRLSLGLMTTRQDVEAAVDAIARITGELLAFLAGRP